MNITSSTSKRKQTDVPDVWLSPRESAELVLGHDRYPRSKRVIFNMQKRVQRACRLHRDESVDEEYRAYFGLVSPAPLPNGQIQVKRSELLRWAERLRIRGLVEAASA